MCGPCRWSSGVIMYTLLAGSPPFWHRKQMLMLRMILGGKYDFSSPEWEDRSDTVKDLVRFSLRRKTYCFVCPVFPVCLQPRRPALAFCPVPLVN